MSGEDSVTICERCGEEITSLSPSLLTIMKMGKVPPEGYAGVVATEENVPLEVAEEWVHHNSLAMCKIQNGYCPFCGGELKTWRAKLCIHCGKAWHEK
jgi:hypothetical protein